MVYGTEQMIHLQVFDQKTCIVFECSETELYQMNGPF